MSLPSDSAAPLSQDIAASPKFERQKRNIWLTAVKIAVSGALIAWILSGADLAAVGQAMIGMDPAWFGVAILMQFAGPALIAWRWQVLLAVQDVRPGWRYLYVSMLVSTFFRQFLPSTVGGDVIRGYDAWRAGASPGFAATSLLVDRLLGLITLALFVMVALGLSQGIAGRISGVWLWVGVGLAAALGFLWLMIAPVTGLTKIASGVIARLPRPIARKLTAIFDALGAFRGHPQAILRGLAISLLLQINVVSFYWAIGQGLGIAIGYEAFYVIVPLAIFVMMAPISINGIGLREGIFIYLFGLWSVGEVEALALAWMEYGIFLAFGLLGGAIYAVRRT